MCTKCMYASVRSPRQRAVYLGDCGGRLRPVRAWILQPKRFGMRIVHKNALGFTLVELMITIAIVGILSTVAVVTSRAASRNANLSHATFDVAIRLSAARAAAMNDGLDRVLVVVDAPGDASGCTSYSAAARCTQLFELQPNATWKLDDFKPETPATNATFIGSYRLASRIHFLGRGASSSRSAPAPFPTTLTLFDTGLTGSCSGAACFAIRFRGDGSVAGERLSSASTARRVGYAFALATDLEGTVSAAGRTGVVVGFPTGIVKTFGF